MLLAAFFGSAAAGLYGLGVRVVSMPIQMIGDALAKAALAQVRERMSDSNYMQEVMLGLFSAVLYISVPIVMLILVGGGEIFSLLFGESWREAGIYAAIVAPVIIVMLSYRILSIVFDLAERQRSRLYFDIALFLARAGPLSIIAAASGSVHTALWAMVGVVGAVYLFGIAYLFGIVGVGMRDVLHRAGWSVILLSPILLLSLVAHYADYPASCVLGLLVVSVIGQYGFIYLAEKSRLWSRI